MLKKIIKKIVFYNFKLRNKVVIRSLDISLKCKLGINITIHKHTSVDAYSEIGSYTYIGKNCNITKTSIGRYCSIANNVSIGQGEHNLNQISTNSIFYEKGYEFLTRKSCVIENDVWIGTDVVILRGVTIGTGAVIGANAVVTKDVPPFAVVVGTPSKVIKYRFNEGKIFKILKSKWWELDLEQSKAKIEELSKC